MDVSISLLVRVSVDANAGYRKGSIIEYCFEVLLPVLNFVSFNDYEEKLLSFRY